MRNAVIGAAIVMTIVVAIILWSPRTPAPVQLQGVDVSISAADVMEKKIKNWTLRLFGQSRPDSELTICRLSSQNIASIIFRRGLPEPDDVATEEFRRIFSPGTERGTRPLLFLQYALKAAKDNPKKTFVITFFTDGENDYRGDCPVLQAVCADLVAQKNILRIGLLGLDPLDNQKVADWETWFAGSNKVIYATHTTDCTDQAIDRLCAEAGKAAKEFAQSGAEGR